MFTIFLNVALAVAVALGFKFGHVATTGWSIFWGCLVFLAAQVVAGLYIQRLIKADMAKIDLLLKECKVRMQKKINFWQSRSPGSTKQAQLELERDQRACIESSLEATVAMERLKWWSPLIGKQIATIRLQLNWMLKDFSLVDQYMTQALLMDPVTASMKLTRMYMRDEFEGMEKFFNQQTRRLRYGQGAVFYALYAWILLQRKDVDGAHKVLIKALENMDNEVIKRNCDHLANNRVNQFNNSGLGDEWYSLHLEQPKVKFQRPRKPTYGRPF